MALQNSFQLRRGTNAERLLITPATGELIYTTDTKAVFVGDGSTAGGNPLNSGGITLDFVLGQGNTTARTMTIAGITLPVAGFKLTGGTAPGQVLTTDGQATPNLSWQTLTPFTWMAPTYTSSGSVTLSALAVGATSFTVANDQTAIFTANRVISFSNSNGAEVSMVANSSFAGGITTVNLLAPITLAYPINTTVYTIAYASQTINSVTPQSNVYGTVTGTNLALNVSFATITLDKVLQTGNTSSLGITVGNGSVSALALRDQQATPSTITLRAPSTATSYSLTLPPSLGTVNQTLILNGTGTLDWGVPPQGALVFKASVIAATTTNITLSGLQTIDGIALAIGDRVLVKDQTTSAQNGIYVAASGAWARSTDLDDPLEFFNAVVIVGGGTISSGFSYIQTRQVTDIATSPQNWIVFSSVGAPTLQAVTVSGNATNITIQAPGVNNATNLLSLGGATSFPVTVSATGLVNIPQTASNALNIVGGLVTNVAQVTSNITHGNPAGQFVTISPTTSSAPMRFQTNTTQGFSFRNGTYDAGSINLYPAPSSASSPIMYVSNVAGAGLSILTGSGVTLGIASAPSTLVSAIQIAGTSANTTLLATSSVTNTSITYSSKGTGRHLFSNYVQKPMQIMHSYRNNRQNISNTTETVVNWDNAYLNTFSTDVTYNAGVWTNASGTTMYLMISYSIEWDSGGNLTNRSAWINVPSRRLGYSYVYSNGSMRLTGSAPYVINNGDSWSVSVYQNSGSTRYVQPTYSHVVFMRLG